MAIEWNAHKNKWETNSSQPRLEKAWPKALNASRALHGFGLYTIIGRSEQHRVASKGCNDVGAHHVSNSVIEEMICAWLNGEISYIQFCGFVGGMLLPPPSYVFSLPMNFMMLGDALSAIGMKVSLIQSLIANLSNADKERSANSLATTLSHLHTNLRQGHGATNSSTSSGVDPRFARAAGLDPIAWIERLFKLVTCDNRPTVAAESIYALSMVRITVPGRENESFTVRGGLLSSVDGEDDLSNSSGKVIKGASRGAFVNPLRSAAHIPGTRYVAPISWSSLMIGIIIMYFIRMIYFQS
jgi:hypothetical protein